MQLRLYAATMSAEGLEPTAFLPQERERRRFYRYDGWLLTAPVTKTVLWNQFASPLQLSALQVIFVRSSSLWRVCIGVTASQNWGWSGC